MSPLLMLILQVLVADLHALPAGEKHQIVVPRQIHAEYKRDTQDKYPEVAKYELHIAEKPRVLYLERNADLIGDNYIETSYDQDDKPIMRSPEKNIKDHCHYGGYVENDSQSVASISTCSGLSGFIMTEGRRFLIKPKDQNSKEHVVYEENETPKTCAATNEPLEESMLAQEAFSDSNNIKEKVDNLQNSWKYIEMFMVADKSLFKKFNKNASEVKNRIYEIVNNMNMAFKAINISVTLVGIEIWDNKDQIVVGASIQDCLRSFSKWRKEKLLPRFPHDNAQLFTAHDFDGPEVGLANIAVMCNDQYSAGVVQDHTKPAVFVAATFVHEVGHNLGMRHDNKSCLCTKLSCIMTPVLSPFAPNTFSKCSLDEFKTFLVTKVPACLLNKPNKETIITPPVCGNKLIEKGEQCDCGTVEECTNPCCDAPKCKLKKEAACADGECCENCQVKKKGSLCRPSLHDCDLPDQCDGKSGGCLDLFKEDGVSCMNGQGYCFHGKCPTLANQCTALWGSDAVVAPDACFFINTMGKQYGYCTEMKGDYQPCPRQDVKCGMNFCSGGFPNPRVNAPVAEAGKCRVVIHPSGKVQDGTKCADKKVCYKGRCQSKDLAYESLACFGECPGQVKCDQTGQCYCNEGQILPKCATPVLKNAISKKV